MLTYGTVTWFDPGGGIGAVSVDGGERVVGVGSMEIDGAAGGRACAAAPGRVHPARRTLRRVGRARLGAVTVLGTATRIDTFDPEEHPRT